MDTKMLNILAGIFTRSNMGFPLPEVYEVSSVKNGRYPPNLDTAVIAFCEGFMEGSDEDDHYSIFMAEGQMWVDTLKNYGEEKARATWPDHFNLYDAA